MILLFKKKKRKKEINIKKKCVGDNSQVLTDCHYNKNNNNNASFTEVFGGVLRFNEGVKWEIKVGLKVSGGVYIR